MAGVPAGYTDEERAALQRAESVSLTLGRKADEVATLPTKSFDAASAKSWGRACDELYTMTKSVGVIANLLGDDDTAQLMGKLTVGFEQLYIGMNGLSTGAVATAGAGSSAATGSLGALSAAGPYIAIAAGALMIGSALFGRKKKSDNGLARAFEAIFAALQQIGKMVEQVLKNQEKMFGVMQVTLQAVRDLETRVALNHDEMRSVTDFIKTEKLCPAGSGFILKN